MEEEQKQPPSRWDTESLDPEERQILMDADNDPTALVTSTEVFSRLGIFSTSCIVINRMIGTGIYSTPATIVMATDSVGGTLLLWVAGFVIAWAGLMVYIEFGLSIPRYTSEDGNKKAIPRSGGEKNYLEYVYRTPKYLTTCVYGVLFIVLGNTAGNAVSFSQYVLEAQCGGTMKCWGETYDSKHPSATFQRLTKVFAVCAITAACLLHGSWRAGGIFVNNFFASVKTCTLLVFIGCGFAYSAGAFPGRGGEPFPTHNLSATSVFESNISGGNFGKLYGYSQSMLLVIFAYGGFENANFILSEIDRPKKTFKRATMMSLILVSVLYILTLIVYFLVLSKEAIANSGALLGVKFFDQISGGSIQVRKAVAAFIAFSSFGNIVVVTFVSSRVKQEIAKEGVLPWSRVIASEVQTPFSWFRNRLRETARVSPSNQESTPLAALFLHWLFSIILVASPKAVDAYLTLLLLHSYALHVWVGFFLAAGLLYLYFKRGSTWKDKQGFKPFGGWIWAAIFALANFFLIIIPWIPPGKLNTFKYILSVTPWYTYPVVAVSLMAAGVLYWVAFAKIYPRIHHKKLTVNRVPIIKDDVQIHEAIFFSWMIPRSKDEEGSEVTELDEFPKKT